MRFVRVTCVTCAISVVHIVLQVQFVKVICVTCAICEGHLGYICDLCGAHCVTSAVCAVHIVLHVLHLWYWVSHVLYHNECFGIVKI